MLKEVNRCLNYIIGVTSGGGICGEANAALYTRVSDYIDWIEKIVWPEETRVGSRFK